MGRRRRGATPQMRFHAHSGQGLVRIDGKVIYLGPWDSQEARAKYHRLVAEWHVEHGHEAKPGRRKAAPPAPVEPTAPPPSSDPPPDLPPLSVATFRERIFGGTNQGRARDATREDVHCGADHREAP